MTEDAREIGPDDACYCEHSKSDREAGNNPQQRHPTSVAPDHGPRNRDEVGN